MIRSHRFAWRSALTFVATIALLGVLVHHFGGSGEFFEAVRAARLPWVCAAFGISCVCVVLGALRWELVLRAMGHDVTLGRCLEVVLAVWPLAVVTPSRANELLRPLALRASVPVAAGAGSVLAEKAVDLVMLLGLAAWGAAASGLWMWSAGIAALLVLEALTLALLGTRKRWIRRVPVLRKHPEILDELFCAFDALRRAPGRLFAVCAVSLAIRVLTVGIVHALLVAVGAEVPLVDTLQLWPAAMLIGVAPVTLAGMGTRDAAFVYLLQTRGLHASAPEVLAATMGYSVVAIWSFAFLGLPLMVRAALFRPAS